VHLRLSHLTGARQTRTIEHDPEIGCAAVRSAETTYISEAVTKLEIGLNNDISLEPGSRPGAKRGSTAR
jgi:hypothetical protein